MSLSIEKKHRLWVLLVLACVAAILPACGMEEESHVNEAETLELGDVGYRVQITRFLNPSDIEDAQYLEGQPVPPPPGKAYLGVFMRVFNEGDSAFRVPAYDQFHVEDTSGTKYEPVSQRTVFSLDPGTSIPPGADLPQPESAAGSGPTGGALLLFLVNTGIGENRPIELLIASDGNKGSIELDI